MWLRPPPPPPPGPQHGSRGRFPVNREHKQEIIPSGASRSLIQRLPRRATSHNPRKKYISLTSLVKQSHQSAHSICLVCLVRATQHSRSLPRLIEKETSRQQSSTKRMADIRIKIPPKGPPCLPHPFMHVLQRRFRPPILSSPRTQYWHDRTQIRIRSPSKPS